jgi:elongation factor 1-gamma
MSLTLYSHDGGFHAFKAQIAAQYNDVELKYVKVDLEAKENRSKSFLAKNPAGKVPVLETPQGCIFESNAIARHVARMRRDTELLGTSFFESGQVDAWVDFVSHDLETPVTLWLYPVLGFLPFNSDVHGEAVADVRRALNVLESHLSTRTYLVGNKITLADVTAVSTLFYPFRFLFAPVFLEAFPSVHRWFVTCVNQPQFVAVLGRFDPCTEEMLAEGSTAQTGAAAGAGAGKGKGKGKKAEKKGKANKKAEKKAAAPAPAPAPAAAAPAKKDKPKKPFEDLKKSSMDGDEWKRTYSNARPYESAMPWLWENFDAEGWSLWHSKYNYNAENKVGFMTSNLVGGFLQRCDGVRKGLFGAMVIFDANDAGLFEIEGVWLMRGTSVDPLLEANPDAEYHTWTKLDHTKDEVREQVKEFWCAEDAIAGRALYDSKLFK